MNSSAFTVAVKAIIKEFDKTPTEASYLSTSFSISMPYFLPAPVLALTSASVSAGAYDGLRCLVLGESSRILYTFGDLD